MARISFLFVFFFVCAIAGGAFASQQKLSLDELSRQADLIIQGRVEDIHTETDEDRSGVTTLVRVTVEDRWKGSRVSTVVVAHPGGAAGELTQRVAGAPRFSLGERVVLFLKKKGGRYVVVGDRQGKFAVKRDPSGEKEVVEDLTGKREALEQFRARVTESRRR